VTTLLFLCTQNAGRSQMAAALFNSMAHPDCARAESAGTHPAEQIHPEVLTVLRERKLNLDGIKPRLVAPEILKSVDRVITLGCGSKVVGVAAQEDWELDDPSGLDIEGVRRIRDQIEKRVWRLIVREGWVRLQPRALLGDRR
jgi:protein-tyrosine-phosphatase